MGNICSYPSICNSKTKFYDYNYKKIDKINKNIITEILTQNSFAGDLCEYCKTMKKNNQIIRNTRRYATPQEIRQLLTLPSQKTGGCTCDKINSNLKCYNNVKTPKQLSDFQVVRGLGKGAYGKVYMVKEKKNIYKTPQSFEYSLKQEEQIPQFNLNDNIDQISQAASHEESSPKKTKQTLTPKKIDAQTCSQKEETYVIGSFKPKNTNNQSSIGQQKLQNQQILQKKENKMLATPEIDKNKHNKQKPERLLIKGKQNLNIQEQQIQNQEKERYFAMKIIEKDRIKTDQDKFHMLSQRYILEAVDHPFIVKLHYAFQTSTKLYLIVDLLPGGQLFYLLRKRRKFSQEIAKFYAAQILLALQYLHNRNIIYRDLKPQNILLDSQGNIKLTDFGLSKVCYSDSQMVYSLCGTPQYIAPEVILGKGYSKAADWFSFGSLVYDMLTGKPPFFSTNKNTMMKNIISKPVPIPTYLSDNAKSLLQGLFKIDPKQRLGYENAEEILKHPFFQSIDFKALQNKKIDPPVTFFKSQASRQNTQSSALQSNKHDQLYVNSGGFQNWNSCDIVQVDNSMMKEQLKDSQNIEQKLQGFTYNRNSSFSPQFLTSLQKLRA